uniref:Uncharacterized protein n=1 Tax=Arundo donax TaxID=35708 RepID=A0A0A9AMC3_ARUDO
MIPWSIVCTVRLFLSILHALRFCNNFTVISSQQTYLTYNHCSTDVP